MQSSSLAKPSRINGTDTGFYFLNVHHLFISWCDFSWISSCSLESVVLPVSYCDNGIVWARLVQLRKCENNVHIHAQHDVRKHIVAQNLIGYGIHYSLACTCTVPKWPWKLIRPKPDQPDCLLWPWKCDFVRSLGRCLCFWSLSTYHLKLNY